MDEVDENEMAATGRDGKYALCLQRHVRRRVDLRIIASNQQTSIQHRNRNQI